MDILLMDQESQVRARFAPSPTGHLHVGNARTALFNWLFARRHGGTFILRVEDTDRERSTRRFEDQLVEDLTWLGLNWDEGPDVGGGYGPYRQSDRGEIYHQHSSRLLSEGKAYLCFCTPEELAEERERAIAEHRPQVYSGKCRALDPEESKKRLAAGQRASVRLRIPPHPIAFEDMVRGRVEFPNDVVSDLIIVRSDNMPVYNFVVVIDDALMKITHVIRGDDHLSNTPRQVAVYEALGWPVPKFSHLSTILGSDRERLSKRHGATSIANFRDLGVLPEALDNYLALLGWAPSGGNRETFSLGELQKEFSLERVTPSPAVFDMEKLHWFNRHYIKVADPERIRELAFHFFARAGLMGSTGTPPANVPDRELSLYRDLPVPVKTWFVQVLDLFLPSVGQLNQLVERALPVFLYDPLKALTAPANAAVMAGEKTEAVIDAFIRLALSHDDGSMTAESFKALVNEVKLLTGAKGKDLFHPIRIVITGSHSGPEFEKLIPIVEQGSKLDLPQHVLSVRQRVQEFAEARHPGKVAS